MPPLNIEFFTYVSDQSRLQLLRINGIWRTAKVGYRGDGISYSPGQILLFASATNREWNDRGIGEIDPPIPGKAHWVTPTYESLIRQHAWVLVNAFFDHAQYHAVSPKEGFHDKSGTD